jgi:hypothetical protein
MMADKIEWGGTPGPWTFNGHAVVNIYDADGNEVCGDVAWGLHDRDAIARAIAEVPAMVSELRNLLAMQKAYYGDGVMTHIRMIGHAEAIKAILARIDGEA